VTGSYARGEFCRRLLPKLVLGVLVLTLQPDVQAQSEGSCPCWWARGSRG
jgi:hypothetical protein